MYIFYEKGDGNGRTKFLTAEKKIVAHIMYLIDGLTDRKLS